MVKKFFDLFNIEVGGIHKAAYLLGFFAILSQILGLIRDRLFASSFGATTNLDLYYSAFRIPDIMFATVASIVSVSVLIPFMMEKMASDETNGGKNAKNFFDTMFTFYLCVMVLMSVIAFVSAPFLLSKLFPVFYADQSRFQTLVMMTRILLLSPFFLGLSNLLASITQIHKRFFIYALSPVIYNFGIIVGITVLYPYFGLTGLVFGVVIGALCHFLIQIPLMFEKGFVPKIRLPFDFSSIKKVVMISLPRTLTVSSNELTELFLVSFASFLIPGSISIFNFSFNLQSVPFSIVGVSYSLAAFPVLIQLFTTGQNDKFVEQMQTTTRHIIFWSVPITTLFIVLRAQIVRILLGAGHFNWNDTRLTAAALALFTMSLVAQNLNTLFVRSYYSRGKTRPPLIMNITSSVLIIIISYFLVRLFETHILFQHFIEDLLRVTNIPGTIVLMLPLGYSIGTLFNLIMHWGAFHLEFPSFSRKVLKTFFQIFQASVIMGFVTYVFLDIFDSIFGITTFLGIFLQGAISGGIGILAGIVTLIALKNEELFVVARTLHSRFAKTPNVIGPDASLD